MREIERGGVKEAQNCLQWQFSFLSSSQTEVGATVSETSSRNSWFRRREGRQAELAVSRGVAALFSGGESSSCNDVAAAATSRQEVGGGRMDNRRRCLAGRAVEDSDRWRCLTRSRQESHDSVPASRPEDGAAARGGPAFDRWLARWLGDDVNVAGSDGGPLQQLAACVVDGSSRKGRGE